MGRPPQIPVEKKTRIVLSVLAGEITIAEAEVRAAVPRRDPRRPRAHRTCRGLPDRIQRDPPAPGDLLEPAPGGAPGPGRPHNPQLRTRRNSANYLTVK